MQRRQEWFSRFDYLRNLAQVFLDGEIGGTPLEGSYLDLNIHYLTSFIQWLQTTQTGALDQAIQNTAKTSLSTENYDKLNGLLKRLQDISAIKQKLDNIVKYAKYPDFSEGKRQHDEPTKLATESLLNLAKDLMDDYNQKGDIFMPGGWSGEVGHQMIYRLTREQSGKTLLRIYNGGAGIDYHGAHISDKGVKSYYPVFGMRCDENLPGLAKLVAKLFSFLVLPQLDKQAEVKPEDIYDKTLGPCKEWLNARWVSGAELFEKSKSPRDMLVSSASSGICVFKAITFIIRPDFVNKSAYRQFILAYRMYLLNNAMQNLDSLVDAANDAPKIVQNCLANTARMLDQHLKPYIAEWKLIEEDRNTITTHLDNWQASLIAIPSKPIGKIAQPDPQSTKIENYSANKFSPLKIQGELDNNQEQITQIIEFNPKHFLAGLQELSAKKTWTIQELEDFCVTYTDINIPLLTQEVKNAKEILQQLMRVVNEYNHAYESITPRKVVFSLSLMMIMERLCGERLFKYANEHLSCLWYIENVMPDFLKMLANNPLLATQDPQLDRQWEKLYLYFTQEAYKIKHKNYFNETFEKSWLQYYIHLIELGPTAEKNAIKAKWDLERNDTSSEGLSDKQRQAIYDLFGEKYAYCYSFLNDLERIEGTQQLRKIFDLQRDIENFYCKNLTKIAREVAVSRQKQSISTDIGIQTYFPGAYPQICFTHGLSMHKFCVNPILIGDRYTQGLYSFETSSIKNALSSRMDNNNYNSHEISSRTPGSTFSPDTFVNASKFPYVVAQLRGRGDEARVESLLHQLLLSPNTQISVILTELLQHPTWLSQKDYQQYIELSFFQPRIMLQTLRNNPAVINQLNEVLKQNHYLKDPSYPESAEWYVLNLCVKVGLYALIAIKNKWLTLPAESTEIISSWKQEILTAIELRLQQSATPSQYRTLYAIKFQTLSAEMDSEKAFGESLLSYVFLILLPKPTEQNQIEAEREEAILQQGLDNLLKAAPAWLQSLDQIGANIVKHIGSLDPLNPMWKEKWGYHSIDLKTNILTLIDQNKKTININLSKKTLTIGDQKIGYLPSKLLLTKDYQKHFGQKQQLTTITEKYYEYKSYDWYGRSEVEEKPSDAKRLELSHTYYTWNLGGTEWRYASTYRDTLLQKNKEGRWYTLVKFNTQNYSDPSAFLDVPILFDQPHYEIWVADSKAYWIEDCNTHAVVYQYKDKKMERIQEPAGVLIKRDIPLSLLRIESEKFIECLEQPDKTIIWHLPRYQLIFKEDKSPDNLFTIDDRHVLIIPSPDEDVFGSGVILQSKTKNTQDEYLIPLQLFYLEGLLDKKGTHYILTHDKDNHIKVKATILNKDQWDFNGTETVVRYPYKNGKIKLKNTSAVDLIYLTYLYLIQEQPETAYRILSRCQLQATAEEMKRLSWLIMYLPVGEKPLASSRITAVQLLALHHIMTITQQDPTLVKQLESQLTTPSRTKTAELVANDEIKGFVSKLPDKMLELFLRYEKAKNNIPINMRLKQNQIAKILSYCHSNASEFLEILGVRYYQYYVKPNESGITTYANKEAVSDVRLIHYDDLNSDVNGIHSISSIYEIAKPSFTETNFIELNEKLNPWMSKENFLIIFPDLFELARQKNTVKDRLIICLKTMLAINQKDNDAIASSVKTLTCLLLSIAKSRNPNLGSIKHMLKQRMAHLPNEDALSKAKAEIENMRYRSDDSPKKSINLNALQNDLSHATHVILTDVFSTVFNWSNNNEYRRYNYSASNYPINISIDSGAFNNTQLIFEVIPHQMITHVRSANDLAISEIKNENVFLDSIYNEVIEKLQPLQTQFEAVRAEVIQELKTLDSLYLEEQEGAFQRLDNKLLKEQNYIQAQQKIIYQEKKPALVANKDKIENIIQNNQARLSEIAIRIEDIIKRRNRHIIQELGKQIPTIDLKFLIKNYISHTFSDWEEFGIQKQDLEDLKFNIDAYLHAHDTEKRLSLLLKGLADDNPQATINALLSQNQATHKHEAIFQYIESLALRPSQARMLKLVVENPEVLNSQVLQLIMGGGKTKVIMPLLLFLFADGKHLPIAIFPEMLLNTNFCDVRATSMKVFDQDAFLLHFDRNSPCETNDLKILYEKLLSTIREKSYVVTDSSSMKSLELKHKELLYLRSHEKEKKPENDIYLDDADSDSEIKENISNSGSDDEENILEEKASPMLISEIDKRVEMLRNILFLFQTQSIGLVDEAHLLLHIMKEMNYSIGTPKHIDPKVIDFISQLYEWLNVTPISNLIPDKTITFRYLIENPNIIPNDEAAFKLMQFYIDQLMQYGTQPAWLQDLLIEGLFINDIKNYLQMHLTNFKSDYPERRQLDEMIYSKLSKHPETLTKLLLLREELSVLLPLTLQKKLHENYGPNPEDLGEMPGKSNSATSCARPYRANNTPSPYVFASFMETFNYTAQMINCDGIFYHEFIRVLTQWKELSTTQRDKNDIAVQQTPIYEIYFNNIFPESGYSIATLNLSDADLMRQLYSTAKKNPFMIAHALPDILTRVQFDPYILRCDSLNFASMLDRIYAFSAIPDNHRTFHSKVNMVKETGLLIESQIKEYLTQKQTPIFESQADSDDVTLNSQLLIKQFLTANSNANALIDCGGLLRGITNLQVANAMRVHPNLQEHIKYILFYQGDSLYAISTKKQSEHSIKLSNTDPNTIEFELGGCKPHERITYYDQEHTVGSDILQSPNCCGLVTLDIKTGISEFLQAVGRLRALSDSQTVVIICPASVMRLLDASQLLNSLFIFLEKNQRIRLQTEHFRASVKKVRDYYRSDINYTLLSKPHSQAAVKLFEAAQNYFIEEQVSDIIAMYKQRDEMQDIAVIMDNYIKQQHDQWRHVVFEDCKSYFSSEELAVREKRLLELTAETAAQALKICSPQYAFPAPQWGTEMQQEKQVENEKKKELKKEQENQFGNNKIMLTDLQYTWLADLKKGALIDKIKKQPQLTALLEQEYKFQCSPDLYASNNLLYYYEKQKPTEIYSLESNPTLTILWLIDKQKLTALILTQEETDRLSAFLFANPSDSTWISTLDCSASTSKPSLSTELKAQESLLIEQIAFLTGRADILVRLGHFNWFETDKKQKLDFFAQVIKPAFGTSEDQMELFTTSVLSLEEHMKEWANPHSDLALTRDWINQLPKMIKKRFNAMYPYLDELRSSILITGKKYDADFFSQKNILAEDVSIILKYQDELLHKNDLQNSAKYILRDPNRRLYFLFSAALTNLPNNLEKGISALKAVIELDPKLKWTIEFTEKLIKYSAELNKKPDFYKECLLYLFQLRLLHNINLDQLWQNNTWETFHVLYKANIYNVDVVKLAINSEAACELISFLSQQNLLKEKTILSILQQNHIPSAEIYNRVNYLNQMQTRLLDIDGILARQDFWEARDILEEMKAESPHTMQRIMDMPFTIDIFKMVVEKFPEIKEPFISNFFQLPLENLMNFIGNLSVLKRLEIKMDEPMLNKLTDPQLNTALAALFHNLILDAPLIQQLFASPYLSAFISFAVQSDWFKKEGGDILFELCDTRYINAVSLLAKAEADSTILLKELAHNPSLMQHLSARYDESPEHSLHATTLQRINAIKNVVRNYQSKVEFKSDEAVLKEFSDKAMSLAIHSDHEIGKPREKEFDRSLDQLCRIFSGKLPFKNALAADMQKSLNPGGSYSVFNLFWSSTPTSQPTESKFSSSNTNKKS